MRKFIIILTVSFFITAFSNLAWSSVEGNWYVQGKVTTKVSAKGQKSKIMKDSIDDVWKFDNGGNFETEGIGGEWIQIGQKIIISFSTGDIIANFEDELSDELDTDITVEELTKVTATGTEKKNGTMNGNFKIIMNIYSSENDIHGKATVSGRFKGTLLQAPTVDISGYWKVYHTKKGSSEMGPDYFSLSQSGNRITGIFTSATGDTIGELYDISGVISDASVSLMFYQDTKVSLMGLASDDAMSGTYKPKEGRPGTWRAERTDSIPAL